MRMGFIFLIFLNCNVFASTYKDSLYSISVYRVTFENGIRTDSSIYKVINHKQDGVVTEIEYTVDGKIYNQVITRYSGEKLVSESILENGVVRTKRDLLYNSKGQVVEERESYKNKSTALTKYAYRDSNLILTSRYTKSNGKWLLVSKELNFYNNKSKILNEIVMKNDSAITSATFYFYTNQSDEFEILSYDGHGKLVQHSRVFNTPQGKIKKLVYFKGKGISLTDYFEYTPFGAILKSESIDGNNKKISRNEYYYHENGQLRRVEKKTFREEMLRVTEYDERGNKAKEESRLLDEVKERLYFFYSNGASKS